MTRREMARLAAGIVPPPGAQGAICVVDDDGHYRAAFLINGRVRSASVGPGFTRPGEAIRLAAHLNGETPASRPERRRRNAT